MAVVGAAVGAAAAPLELLMTGGGSAFPKRNHETSAQRRAGERIVEEVKEATSSLAHRHRRRTDRHQGPRTTAVAHPGRFPHNQVNTRATPPPGSHIATELRPAVDSDEAG